MRGTIVAALAIILVGVIVGALYAFLIAPTPSRVTDSTTEQESRDTAKQRAAANQVFDKIVEMAGPEMSVDLTFEGSGGPECDAVTQAMEIELGRHPAAWRRLMSAIMQDQNEQRLYDEVRALDRYSTERRCDKFTEQAKKVMILLGLELPSVEMPDAADVASAMPAQPAAAPDFQKGLTAAQRGDYTTALREWRPLAEQGNADAQYNLGVMYRDGLGVTQDYVEAVKWFRKPAEHVLAEHNLGVLYERGQGVAQNHVEALKWYRKAAERGLAEAQYNVGFMYRNGYGVLQDDAEAVRWYEKAAEQGVPLAQNNLAFMYGNGHGVPQDDVLALMWWSLAAAGGYEDAAMGRDQVAARMAPAEVAKAERLAREWLEKHGDEQ
jgi:TPR repeat protein